jgi:hypothetical protein
MGPQFIRVVRARENKEILISINSIWKIEVEYFHQPTQPGESEGHCSLEKGLSDPNAARRYTVFAGGETIKLRAKPGSKVMQIFEEIYKNAVADEDNIANE